MPFDFVVHLCLGSALAVPSGHKLMVPVPDLGQAGLQK